MLIATLRDPSGNFLGESSRGSDENIPRQAPCVTYVAGRIFSPWKAKKNGRRKGRGGEGKGRIATPLLPIGVEAPVQSSWHTYELCIRRSLCAIVRCIIIPEKVSATIPSGTYMDIRGTDGKMYGMGSSRRGAG